MTAQDPDYEAFLRWRAEQQGTAEPPAQDQQDPLPDPEPGAGAGQDPAPGQDPQPEPAQDQDPAPAPEPGPEPEPVQPGAWWYDASAGNWRPPHEAEPAAAPGKAGAALAHAGLGHLGRILDLARNELAGLAGG